MAVSDAGWWAVWWPWLTLWALACAGAGLTVLFTVRYRSEHQRRVRENLASGRLYPRIVYLNGASIMDVFEQLDDPQRKKVVRRAVPAGEREVEERKATDDRLGGTVDPTAPTVTAERSRVEEFVQRYVLDSPTPVQAMKVIIDVLDAKDAIVQVNLVEKAGPSDGRPASDVLAGRALDLALRRTGHGVAEGGHLKPIQLHRLQSPSYVLLDAVWTRTGAERRSLFFEATYEGVEGKPARVRLRCNQDERLQTDTESEPFRGICLGLVRHWAHDGVLHVEPVAIFS